MTTNFRLHLGARPGRQQGLTLIELMVAMAISLVVVLAATTALVISRQGFTNVDASAQLRDNARFAEDIIQRLGVQAGFEDLFHAASSPPPKTAGLDSTTVPNVFVYGFNNRARGASQGWSEANSAARTSGSLGYGSDILVLRFQPNVSNSKSNESDRALIDCAGEQPTQVPTSRYDRITSVLHVATSSAGEPALMCTRWSSGGTIDTQPLISGVENFQVLYGVDGIGPSNSTIPATSTADSVVDRYLRADQLTVSDESVTAANWQRVRSIRIGLVLRASPGTAVDRTTQTFYPLGPAPQAANGTAGSMFANNSADPGSVFTPTADGRLRQVLTFTVHLRNPQGEL
ncbi:MULTISPECIES: PilW family protein [unclassified Acidovorax]|uniref:PilW family protein n=1 Tax=unclassified Acidovorax TaxID=2684926 RepID=UPI002882FFD3|nr:MULTISPECIES: PilW family protein [unclassified Acidovorax]